MEGLAAAEASVELRAGTEVGGDAEPDPGSNGFTHGEAVTFVGIDGAGAASGDDEHDAVTSSMVAARARKAERSGACTDHLVRKGFRGTVSADPLRFQTRSQVVDNPSVQVSRSCSNIVRTPLAPTARAVIPWTGCPIVDCRSAAPRPPAGGVPVPPIVEAGLVSEQVVGRPDDQVRAAGGDQLLTPRAAVGLAGRGAAVGGSDLPTASVTGGLVLSPAVGDRADVERNVASTVVALARSSSHEIEDRRIGHPPRSTARS